MARDNWEGAIKIQNTPLEQTETQEETQEETQAETQAAEGTQETEEIQKTEQTIKKEDTKLKAETNEKPTEQLSVNQEEKAGYLLPESDSRYISPSELEGMSKEELKIARNEIYARHGRKFAHEDLQEHFNQQEWYSPEVDTNEFQDVVLNEYEQKNCNLIMQYEKNR